MSSNEDALKKEKQDIILNAIGNGGFTDEHRRKLDILQLKFDKMELTQSYSQDELLSHIKVLVAKLCDSHEDGQCHIDEVIKASDRHPILNRYKPPIIAWLVFCHPKIRKLQDLKMEMVHE